MAHSGMNMGEEESKTEVAQGTYFVVFGLAVIALVVTAFAYPVWGF